MPNLSANDEGWWNRLWKISTCKEESVTPRPGSSGIWDFPPCRSGLQTEVVDFKSMGWVVGSWDDYHVESLGEFFERSQGWWEAKRKTQNPQNHRWRDDSHKVGKLGLSSSKVRQAFEKKAATKARITYKSAVRMEGYAISHNHGSRKWPLWRLNSSSRKTMFHSHVGGRVVFIDWWVWSWGDHCLCHWGSWCLQAKQSIMCHDSSKKSILFKAVFFLVTCWWNFKLQSFHWKRFLPLPGPFEFGRLRVQTATGPSKICSQNSVLAIDLYQGSLHYPFGGESNKYNFQGFPSLWCIVWDVFFMSPILS